MKILFFSPAIWAIPISLGHAFEWTDTKGKHLDLTHDDRPLARYIYEPIDESSPQRREATYKPFCHIYDRHLKNHFITKGPGGQFTHHRGIFYGFFTSQLLRS